MDVRQYFESVDFSLYAEKTQVSWKYSLGNTIENITTKTTESNIHKLEVVIFGVPCNNGIWEEGKTKSTDKTRSELYQLSKLNGKLKIADFGNLKSTHSLRGTYLALRDIVEYFNELNIVTVIIGGSQDLNIGICEAFKNHRYFSFSTIDSYLDVKKGRESYDSSNFLTRIFQKLPDLFQFNLLAFQSYLVANELFSKSKGIGNHLRLGILHDNLKEAEPVLRNTDVLTFDFNAIKYSEIAGSSFINPNGLSSEEACQLAKYAGISEKLKVFGIYETDIKKDSVGITFKLSAQIIWYFFEGIINRSNIDFENSDKIRRYKVEVNDIDNPILFLQCTATNRWWFEIESLNDEKIIIACSEREYQQASNNEIPELWIKYIQKIDEISK